MKAPYLVMLAALLVLGCVTHASAQRFSVLVTTDDGVGAPGISALVDHLKLNENLDVTVVAPLKNRSGTGDKFTAEGTLTVTQTSTAGGFPALALDGFPADTVLFAVLKHLPAPPDLVVSGINQGQNVMEGVEFSGTVGAALWAARLGIPAIAVSQGFGEEIDSPLDYSTAAVYTANVVEALRTQRLFQLRMQEGNRRGQRLVLNINFPTCSGGAVRGVKVVPLDRMQRVTQYSLVSDNETSRRYQPGTEAKNYLLQPDCRSSLSSPSTDYSAFMNGFATITPLGPDLTLDPSWHRFSFLEKIAYK